MYIDSYFISMFFFTVIIKNSNFTFFKLDIVKTNQKSKIIFHFMSVRTLVRSIYVTSPQPTTIKDHALRRARDESTATATAATALPPAAAPSTRRRQRKRRRRRTNSFDGDSNDKATGVVVAALRQRSEQWRPARARL